MGAMTSQITNLTIVYSTVYSGTDQRKHQSSVSLAFVQGIHRSPVNSPYKWPVMRKFFPFDDVIMYPPGERITSFWNANWGDQISHYTNFQQLFFLNNWVIQNFTLVSEINVHIDFCSWITMLIRLMSHEHQMWLISPVTCLFVQKLRQNSSVYCPFVQKIHW